MYASGVYLSRLRVARAKHAWFLIGQRTRLPFAVSKSLEGHWQSDLLFLLKQEQDGYEFCQKQMAECDHQLAQYLQQREDRSHGALLPEEERKGRRIRHSSICAKGCFA